MRACRFGIGQVGPHPYLGVEIFLLLGQFMPWPSTWYSAPQACRRLATGLTSALAPTPSDLPNSTFVANLWALVSASRFWPPWIGWALLVGLFISHRRGIYFAFLTIAFGQIFWTIAIKAYGLTGGEDGLLRIARLPADLGIVSFDLKDNLSLYYFVLTGFAIVVVVLWRLCIHPTVACWRRSGRVKHEPRTWVIRCWVHKLSIFDVVSRDLRLGRRFVRNGSTLGVSRRHEPEPIRPNCNDDI